MEENIANGIAAALSQEFGDEYNIYTDSVEQGLKRPCFFILHKGTKYDFLPMNRCIAYYEFELDLIINEKFNQKINSIAQRVFNAIKRVDCSDGYINAFNLQFEANEGSYKIQAVYCMSGKFSEGEYELMEKLDINEGE